MVINRIAPFSLAKVSGILYAILGLIFGALLSLVTIGGIAAGGDRSMFGMFGIGAVIMLPIFYGCAGFVVSLVGAWLYNVLAGMVGGVELDVT
jgi:hypothetical protein